MLYSATHVKFYIIIYQRIGWRFICNASGDKKLFQKNTTDTTFILGNLEPSGIYRVHVRAHIISKYSTFEDIIKSEVIVEMPGTSK